MTPYSPASPTNSPAVSGSAWRWRGRWSSGQLLLLDGAPGCAGSKAREHTQFELINIQEQLGVDVRRP